MPTELKKQASNKHLYFPKKSHHRWRKKTFKKQLSSRDRVREGSPVGGEDLQWKGFVKKVGFNWVLF